MQYSGGIELDLDLDVGGGHLERAGQLGGEPGRSFFGAVDEAVAAVAVTREDFEEVVVVTFPADAKAIEGDALLAMGLDLPLERFGFDIAQVGGAVGQEHDAVDAVGQVMAEGGQVGEVHGLLEIGATLRGEVADLGRRLGRLAAGDAVHPELGGAREGDDAELVLGLELGGQDAQGRG